MKPGASVSEAVLTQIATDIHQTAQEKGFWVPSSEFIQQMNTKLLLIVSEVAEAMEVLRKPYGGENTEFYQRYEMDIFQLADFLEELADIVIRTFDLAQFFSDVQFPKIILDKMEKNQARPHMHAKRF